MFLDRDSLPVLCRPALTKDTSDVLELSSHIWEGHDYIPFVWNDWLADEQGLLAIAESTGRVVGLAKLSRFTVGDWFMEGLRVHPEWRDKGIASRLNKYILDHWYKYCEGSVRLGTASFNIKVHHMCVENGFEKIGEFIPHTASALPEVVTEFRLVTTEEYPSVLEFIQRSESFQSSFGLLDMGWRWARLAEVHLNDALSHNQIWWWRGDQGCLGFWLDEEDEDNRPQILFVACEMDRLGEMLLDFRKLAAQLGHNMVAWTAPHDHLANAALGKAGFERSWEHSIFVFELER